jgi:hypothetical protein
MNFDFESLQTVSLSWRLCWSFLGGVVTSLGPCNVATIPLIVGYVGGSRDLVALPFFCLSLAFAIGLAVDLYAAGPGCGPGWRLVGAATPGGITWWRDLFRDRPEYARCAKTPASDCGLAVCASALA